VTRTLYDRIGPYREDLGTAADQEFFLRAASVMEPAVIPGFVAAFEAGGVSQEEGIIGRELVWHRLRLASGTAFGGFGATDALVTVYLLVRQILLWGLNKVRRRLGRR
jgi:hypothetical protein